MSPAGNVTELLVAWGRGDQGALDVLAPLVQQELHRLATRYMAGERPGHVLQATALVNEAYLRLVDWKGVRWQNRAHFFAMAAQIMRHILVDKARARARAKRGGAPFHVSLSEAAQVSLGKSVDSRGARRRAQEPRGAARTPEPCRRVALLWRARS